jgi:pantetheine-phosphate adenylyltransferase
MTAVYAGRFDPVTLGHTDICRRAAKIADKLIVAVLDDPAIQTAFPIHERLAFVKDACKDIKNAKVDAFSGILAAYARQVKAGAFVRGIRNAADLESEQQMGHFNRLLTDGTDTVFLTADPVYRHISGSAVREAARLIYGNGYDDTVLSKMVTPVVLHALKTRFLMS